MTTAVRETDRAAEAAEELLRRQAGVITREQALACGITRGTVDRRLATRRWVPVHPQVYRDAHHPPSEAARMWAAVSWVGAGAVLSGLAAAWWHGLAPPPATVAVTVPRRRAVRGRADITVRRRDVHPADRVRLRGLAVTAPALSVLEGAVELGAAGGPFLDRTLRAGADFGALAAAASRSTGGRDAVGGQALLLGAADRAVAAARARLVAYLRAERIGGWRRDHPAAGLVVGVAFPQLRVALVGADPAVALDEERRVREAWRDRVLAREGWRVVRYGVADPAEEVVAAVVGTRTTS